MDAMIDCPYCRKSESACECRWFPQNCPALPVLTAKQAALLLFIDQHVKDKGYPPSLREMAERFRWKALTNAPNEHLAALVKKGYLARGPKRAGRAMTVLALPQ